MQRVRRATCCVVGVIAACAVAAVAAAEEGFYAGKTIELIVGYPPAGSNDIYGRIVAQHLGKYVPGAPKIIVRNMPGAGSLTAANHIFNRAPRDGTILGLVSPGMPLQARLGNPQVRYEPDKLQWVGRIQSSSAVTMVWHTSKVMTLDDARRAEVVLSATGSGSTGSLYPNVMNEVLKTRFKLVQGYKGTHEAMLAMERGEAEGHSTSWDALRSVNMRWVRDGSVRIIVQHALERARDLPDVPTSFELATDPEDRAVMRAILSAVEVGKAFFSTPDVPPERLTALRRGFDAMLADPRFVEDVERVHGDVGPMTGEQLQALVAELDAFPPAVIERVKVLYK